MTREELHRFAILHNQSLPEKFDYYLVVTSGEKRKRFSVWMHQTYRRYFEGKTYIQISKREKSHQFYSNTESLIFDLENFLKKQSEINGNKFHINIEVDSVLGMKEDDAPKHRKIPFGKYKYLDIDKVAEIDPNYHEWITEYIRKRVEKNGGEMKFGDFDHYVIDKDSYFKAVENRNNRLSHLDNIKQQHIQKTVRESLENNNVDEEAIQQAVDKIK